VTAVCHRPGPWGVHEFIGTFSSGNSMIIGTRTSRAFARILWNRDRPAARVRVLFAVAGPAYFRETTSGKRKAPSAAFGIVLVRP
jgi:hypothetical protein